VANVVYEQPDSLEPAAEQFDLRLRVSDWFDLSSGNGIASQASFREAAFSDDVLQQGLNSEAIELGDERVVFVHLHDRKPAQSQPLEQVRQRVRAELIREKLGELGSDAGREALSRLRAGLPLDELAEEWEVDVIDHGFVGRDQAQADAELRRGFSMAKPEQGLVFDGLLLDDGEYVIIELSAVMSNDGESGQGDLDGLLRARGGAEYQSVLEYLGARAEVVRTPLDEIDLDEI